MEEDVDIISVSEPAWVLRRGWAPPGYVSVRPHITPENDILALLLVRATLEPSAIYAPNARVAGATIRTTAADRNVVSVYVQPGTGVGLQALSELLDNHKPRESRPQEWIIAGDFNSRHPLWGPEDEPETNQASTILELCADYQLLELNRYPCPPTFTSVNGQSWIDLTLSSAELAGLTTWAVRNDLVSLSDHQIVETQIWRQADLPKNRTKQNWRKADWQAIQTSLTDALLDFPEASSWQALTPRPRNLTRTRWHSPLSSRKLPSPMCLSQDQASRGSIGGTQSSSSSTGHSKERSAVGRSINEDSVGRRPFWWIRCSRSRPSSSKPSSNARDWLGESSSRPTRRPRRICGRQSEESRRLIQDQLWTLYMTKTEPSDRIQRKLQMP